MPTRFWLMPKGLELEAAYEAAEQNLRDYLGCKNHEQLVGATDCWWSGDETTVFFGPEHEADRYQEDVVRKQVWETPDLFAALLDDGCGNQAISVFNKAKRVLVG